VTKQKPSEDAKKQPAPDAVGAEPVGGEPGGDQHGKPGTVQQPAEQSPAGQPSQTAQASAAAEEQLAQLRQELEEMKDRALRAAAELDNYRKRAQRELQDALRYANMPLLRDLLPVLDNVGRALDSAEKIPNAGPLVEGIKLVAQQLEGVLAKHHCEPIDALHSPFDPNLHEAVMQQPSAEHPPNTVLAVVQRGYRLHDRVVRPSQVIVASAPSQDSSAADQDRAGDGNKPAADPTSG
jgi:molecular chaperone GrpE